MNKIEEMIKQMCPEGVKRVNISSFAHVLRGKRLTKSQLNENGKYPVYHGGQIPIGYYDEANRVGDTVMVINVGASAGTINYCDKDFWSSDGCFCLSRNDAVSNKYLYLALLENERLIKSQVRNAGIPTLDQKAIENISIPLPPLPIQQDIVSILDSFTSLQSKLEEELASRQQQMEYYREKLLSFDKDDESVKWMKLGDIGTFTRGNGLQKRDFTDYGVGCIHYGQIYTRLSMFVDEVLTYVNEDLANHLTEVNPGDIVMACTSENVEDVCKSVVWLGKDKIVTGGHSVVYRHNQNPKYIGYFLKSDIFYKQKVKYVYGAKVIDIKTDKLALIEIPVPSRSRQQEIVSTLDTMSSLIDKLKEEIELRKKQYEYYREALLSF